MEYSEFLELLRAEADAEYAAFQTKLIKSERYRVIGVRVPVLRKIAKKLSPFFSDVYSFPNTYYETVFLKLTLVSALPYEAFLSCLFDCVALIDDWALCDCFSAKCIDRHREEFLPVLAGLFERNEEFSSRFVLVTLLSHYMSEAYLPLIFSYLLRADSGRYYEMMGAAWLLAEVLVRHYDRGVLFLREGKLVKRLQNKAIQKACESFRLTDSQKCLLKTLKK